MKNDYSEYCSGKGLIGFSSHENPTDMAGSPLSGSFPDPIRHFYIY